MQWNSKKKWNYKKLVFYLNIIVHFSVPLSTVLQQPVISTRVQLTINSKYYNTYSHTKQQHNINCLYKNVLVWVVMQVEEYFQ